MHGANRDGACDAPTRDDRSVAPAESFAKALRAFGLALAACGANMRIGLLPVCRSTFDVEYAESKLSGAIGVLGNCEVEIVGSNRPVMDSAAARARMDALLDEGFDRLLVLQLTFTDAAAVSEAANRTGKPLSIWAFREPREGGRLRLNSFCGLNLASHALSMSGKRFSWLYSDPESTSEASIAGMISGKRRTSAPAAQPPARRGGGPSVAPALKGLRIGRIGMRPDGFDTCDYDAEALAERTGMAVDVMELRELFDEAESADEHAVEALAESAENTLRNMGDMDKEAVHRSLRLKIAMDALRDRRNLHAFAVRCWPETFTEFGGAVCGPASMLGEAGVPCACEADVWGAASQLMLNRISGAPSFLADLVDIDAEDGTGVFWHCGQAPVSMRDPEADPEATIHSNRKLPLLYQFPLRPGRATAMRLSKSHGREKLVMFSGEMIRRPLAFSGTAGVMRFDRPAEKMLEDVISSGLEHHVAIAYGEFKQTLAEAAADLELPVLEL